LDLAVLTAILILAAILRLGAPGISEFKYDEAMISRRALDLVHKGIWPASTISSIPGIPQPSLKALILAIPFAVSRNPAVAVAFQGALGVLSVGATYLLGKRYFNARVGVIAAMLLAFAPWAIFYDREIWSQNLPIFTLLMMFGLYMFVIEHRSQAIVMTLVALGLLIGFYLGNLILTGVVVFALILYPRSLGIAQPDGHDARRTVWLGVGIIGLLVTLVPYVMELASGRVDLNQALHSNGGVGERVFLPVEQIRFAAHVGTGYQFHALAGDQFRSYYQTLPLPDLGGVLDRGTMWLIMAAMAYVLVRSFWIAIRRSDPPSDFPAAPPGARYVLLALWISVPIVSWSVSGLKPWPHRYIMMYPAQHLALAVMVSDGIDWAGSRWPLAKNAVMVLVASWLCALAVWQSVEYLGMLRFVNTVPIVGGHGRPVRMLWGAAQEARGLAKPGNLPIVIHTDGADPEHDGGPAEFDAVLGDFHLYLLGDERLEVVPAGRYVWIWDSGDGSYDVELRMPPEVSDSASLARLANGVELIRVEVQQPPQGQPVSVDLTWRIWDLAAGNFDYGYTVQLYTEDDQRLGQVDGQFVRSMYWRTGDLVVASVSVPVAADMPSTSAHHLLFAMYAYLPDTQQGVDILDAAGNPAGQSIDVSLD